jgi:hypothetical protein
MTGPADDDVSILVELRALLVERDNTLQWVDNVAPRLARLLAAHTNSPDDLAAATRALMHLGSALVRQGASAAAQELADFLSHAGALFAKTTSLPGFRDEMSKLERATPSELVGRADSSSLTFVSQRATPQGAVSANPVELMLALKKR